MGRIRLSQLHTCDDLPTRMGYGRASEMGSWYYRDGQYHSTDGIYPYDRIKRLLKHNIGKDVNNVFSYYCKSVPKYQQAYFWEIVTGEMRYYKRFNTFYVDDNNLIQYNGCENTYKGPYQIVSEDFKIERRHKITNQLEPELDYWGKPKYTWSISNKERKILNNYNKEDYKTIIVKGWEKWFDSKQNREYKRLKGERLKKRNRQSKLAQKKYKNRLSEQDMRIILRDRDLKEKEANLVKIISHGFCPKTSFRKEKIGVTEH